MIVGLTGPARCGKNTIADYLVANHGFTRIAFSDALYKEVAEAFDVPEEVLRSEATKDAKALTLAQCSNGVFARIATELIDARYRATGGPLLLAPWKEPLSPREILQWWGTEYRRAQDPQYWVKRLAEKMCQLTGDGGDIHEARVAVDGVRFPNEEAFLRSLPGFEMWHIVRRDAPQVASHASEAEQKRITVDVERDVVIQNNGTIEQLRAIVDQIMQHAEGRL